jgi:hypothetical protein
MKLFAKTEISWNEPLLFVLRLRRRKPWIVRGLIALGIAAILFAAMYFSRRPAFHLGSALGVSVMAGLVLVLLPDLAFFQREITIKSDGILCYGSVGPVTTSAEFPFTQVQSVDLVRPEDWGRPRPAMLLHRLGIRMPGADGRPYGAMLVYSTDDSFLIAVPHKVDLATVANVLHRLGVSVQLADWSPSESDTRIQVRDEVVLSPQAAKHAAPARIWPVTEQDGRLSPTTATVVSFIIALAPLAVSLLGALAAAVYVIVNWNAVGTLNKVLIGGGALAAPVISLVYLILVGQFLASRYLIRVGQNRLRVRPNSLFNADAYGLIPVEVYDRTAWTSLFSKSVDFGFLQLDPRDRMLRFEGDKQRWNLPAAALTTCRIEEAHVGSEGNQQAEKRYYVVISVEHDGQPWEAGMIRTRTRFGNDGRDQRYALARELLGELEQVVGSGRA